MNELTSLLLYGDRVTECVTAEKFFRNFPRAAGAPGNTTAANGVTAPPPVVKNVRRVVYICAPFPDIGGCGVLGRDG